MAWPQCVTAGDKQAALHINNEELFISRLRDELGRSRRGGKKELLAGGAVERI